MSPSFYAKKYSKKLEEKDNKIMSQLNKVPQYKLYFFVVVVEICRQGENRNK